jgi:hypothetical protein
MGDVATVRTGTHHRVTPLSSQRAPSSHNPPPLAGEFAASRSGTTFKVATPPLPTRPFPPPSSPTRGGGGRRPEGDPIQSHTRPLKMRPATSSPNPQDATSILNEAVRRCKRSPREVDGTTQSPSGALRHLPLPGGGDQPGFVVGFSYPGAEKVPEIRVSARRGEHPVAVNLGRRQCTLLEAARESLAALELWVARERHLGLKVRPQIGRSRAGLPFLGFVVTPGRLGLLRRRRRRFRAALARWESAFVSGRIHAAQLQAGVQAVLSITHHADAGAFRQGLLARRVVLDV